MHCSKPGFKLRRQLPSEGSWTGGRGTEACAFQRPAVVRVAERQILLSGSTVTRSEEDT